ncbi:unnamed protein product [Lymnaea stagnalis]|uniref:TRAF3-interacting protein 1 n=1 Tax=Lymnaea stagnalis TaxID=6523 RepID=A0AAV2HIH3_LYMST
MDPKIAKKTQDTLGKIIKKPPLTEKLLGKPPFRFLHDITTSVIKTTGFMQGLFTESEMNSENVKEKNDKIAFLQKAIDIVVAVTGKPVSAKPIKIVAGHEPERTNEFLQALADAINKNVNNDEYVKKVLKGAGQPKEEKKEEKRDKDRTKEKSEKRKVGESEAREREKERDRDRDRHKEKDRERDSKAKDESKEGRDKEDRRREERPREKEERSKDKEERSRDKDDKHKDKEDRQRDRSKKVRIYSYHHCSYDSKPLRHPDNANPNLVPGFNISQVGEASAAAAGRLQHSPGGDVGLPKQSCRAQTIGGLTKAASRNHVEELATGDHVIFYAFIVLDPDLLSLCFYLLKIANEKKKNDANHYDLFQREHSKEKENESPDRDKGEQEEKQPAMMNSPHAPPEVFTFPYLSLKDAPARLQRPSSAKGSRRRREAAIILSCSENVSRYIARPAPPRPKQDIIESEPAMRLGTGQPTNLIVDNDDDDEDENFLVEESAPPLPETDLVLLIMLSSCVAPNVFVCWSGALVKKMLESKKDLEGGSKNQALKKTEIERPALSDAQRRKQRELVQKEVDKLRGSIQSLTRSANPLGKVMDYVQEDLDSMQQELDKWREENAQHALELKREMNVTDRAVEPLKQQLTELERAIKDQLDQIAATKANIIKNDQKIQKMLHGISSS